MTKRSLFIFSFCLLFAGSVFGQNKQSTKSTTNKYSSNSKYSKKSTKQTVKQTWNSNKAGHNKKFDDDLDRKVQASKTNGKGNERFRVIVQNLSKINTVDKADLKAKGGKVTRDFKRFNGYVAEMTASQLEKFSGNLNVRHVSLDFKVKAHSEASVVSGAALAEQTYGVTGAGIGVAVIDSGIAAHADLQNVVKSVDFVEPTRTGGAYDPYGHGTHVAGILAGSGSASSGLHKGVAPGASLVDLRVLDSAGGGYTSDVIAAIEWAVDNKNAMGSNNQPMNIRVINLSLGHRPYEGTDTDPLTVACKTAVQNGIVVVVAAGNFGKDVNGTTLYGGITSPGTEPAVITVGAMTVWGTDSRSDDSVATYSSRGPTMVENLIKPDLSAPGSVVVGPMSAGSTLATENVGLQVDGSYLKLSGTSMASPVVAGAVALMLQENPGLAPNAVKAALMFTAEERNANVLAVGAGYVNIAGAVNLVANIDTTVTVGQYWLVNAGTGLNYSNLIAGSPVSWGQSIIVNYAAFTGNPIFFNETVWGSNIAWDDIDGLNIAWDDLEGLNIAWDDIDGLNIAWDDLDGLNIAWDDLDGLNIAWDDVDGLNIAWDGL